MLAKLNIFLCGWSGVLKDPTLSYTTHFFSLHELRHGFGFSSQNLVFTWDRIGPSFAHVGSNMKITGFRFRAELKCSWFKLDFPSCSWKFSWILLHSLCLDWFSFVLPFFLSGWIRNWEEFFPQSGICTDAFFSREQVTCKRSIRLSNSPGFPIPRWHRAFFLLYFQGHLCVKGLF